MKALSRASAARDATIYQVAEQAGVSIATVSRVLRGTARVAPRTRERVESAVEDLQFTPSRPARSLAEGQHAAAGIVFPDLSGPYFAEVVLGYEEVAAEHGRTVLILSTHGRQAARELVLDLASRVDGLVVLGRTVGDDVLADLAGKQLPLVLLARDPVEGADTATTENLHSAQALTRHLLDEHGYRSIGFLGDPAISSDASRRWSGVRRVLRAAGLPTERAVTRCGFDEESGRTAALRLLRTRPPRALVCANDEIALGAVLAAEELGLRVPDDLAVTGWDDVMAARHARPALTTVRQPMRELGAWAAHRLQLRLAGAHASPDLASPDLASPDLASPHPTETTHEVLPTQLVRRASCGHHPEEDR